MYVEETRNKTKYSVFVLADDSQFFTSVILIRGVIGKFWDWTWHVANPRLKFTEPGKNLN